MNSKNNSECKFFGECGGCDFLDLSAQNYQNLKIKSLEEVLAKFNCEVNYHWLGKQNRRKITLQVSNYNKAGFFAKKSQIISEIDACIVAEKKLSNLISPLQKLLKSLEENIVKQITLTSFDSGIDLIFHCKKELNFSFENKVISFAKEHNLNASCKVNNHLTPLFLSNKNQIFYPTFKINLDSEIFIQATKDGLDKIIELINGEIIENINVADIYAGFGAYTFAIAPTAFVTAFEGNEEMSKLIKKNADTNSLNHKIKSVHRDLFSTPLDAKELNKFDLVIINPPRNGATPQIEQIAKSKVNHIIYVSCNPKTFSFDSKILINFGFKITKIDALDQFYGSKHLELVAIFKR